MYRRFKCDCEKHTVAKWCYMPSSKNIVYHYFCDDCVPRGCSCNHEYTPDSPVGIGNGFGEFPPNENEVGWKWLEKPYKWCMTDESGRQFPCCEFDYSSDGYVAEKDELDFYKLNGIKYNL